jgi:hypothetical protein
LSWFQQQQQQDHHRLSLESGGINHSLAPLLLVRRTLSPQEKVKVVIVSLSKLRDPFRPTIVRPTTRRIRE